VLVQTAVPTQLVQTTAVPIVPVRTAVQTQLISTTAVKKVPVQNAVNNQYVVIRVTCHLREPELASQEAVGLASEEANTKHNQQVRSQELQQRTAPRGKQVQDGRAAVATLYVNVNKTTIAVVHHQTESRVVVDRPPEGRQNVNVTEVLLEEAQAEVAVEETIQAVPRIRVRHLTPDPRAPSAVAADAAPVRDLALDVIVIIVLALDQREAFVATRASATSCTTTWTRPRRCGTRPCGTRSFASSRASTVYPS
jgi:hypothetical protein